MHYLYNTDFFRMTLFSLLIESIFVFQERFATICGYLKDKSMNFKDDICFVWYSDSWRKLLFEVLYIYWRCCLLLIFIVFMSVLLTKQCSKMSVQVNSGLSFHDFFYMNEDMWTRLSSSFHAMLSTCGSWEGLQKIEDVVKQWVPFVFSVLSVSFSGGVGRFVPNGHGGGDRWCCSAWSFSDINVLQLIPLCFTVHNLGESDREHFGILRNVADK
jgi:hypothetical protein